MSGAEQMFTLAEVNKREVAAFNRGRYPFPNQHYQTCDDCETGVQVVYYGPKKEPQEWDNAGVDCPVCGSSLGANLWDYDGLVDA